MSMWVSLPEDSSKFLVPVILSNIMTVQLKTVPDYKGSAFNPEVLPNEDHEPSSERAERHEEYAHLWNNVSPTAPYPNQN